MTVRGPRGLLFPVLLILTGVVVLLGDLGYIQPISWAAVARLWPVVLIVLGIELIVGRRQPLLALGLELAVIVVAVAALAGASTLSPLVAPAGSVTSEASVPREGARSLDLRLSGGAGTYRLEGGATALVEARATGADLRVLQDRSGGDVEVTVEPQDRGPFDLFRERIEVRTRIAGDLPAAIRVDGGAGDFTIDLSDVQASEARLSVGAASVRLVLPRPRGDVPVRVDAGAASLEIVVPAGVEARVAVQGGAVSLDSANDRLRPAAGAAETPGYGGAADRVTVSVQGGATSVTIR